MKPVNFDLLQGAFFASSGTDLLGERLFIASMQTFDDGHGISVCVEARDEDGRDVLLSGRIRGGRVRFRRQPRRPKETP